jgi:hypothetical protein
MKNLLRMLFAFIECFRRWPSGQNVWEEQDAHNLAVFLNSPTGKRLTNKLVRHTAAINEEAVMCGTADKCGEARGFKRLICYLFEFADRERIAVTPSDAHDDQGITSNWS